MKGELCMANKACVHDKFVDFIESLDNEELEALADELADRVGDVFASESGAVKVIITRKERAQRFFYDLFESYI